MEIFFLSFFDIFADFDDMTSCRYLTSRVFRMLKLLLLLCLFHFVQKTNLEQHLKWTYGHLSRKKIFIFVCLKNLDTSDNILILYIILNRKMAELCNKYSLVYLKDIANSFFSAVLFNMLKRVSCI